MAPTDGIVSDAGWFLHFQPIHYTTIFAHSVITTQSQQGGGLYIGAWSETNLTPEPWPILQ